MLPRNHSFGCIPGLSTQAHAWRKQPLQSRSLEAALRQDAPPHGRRSCKSTAVLLPNSAFLMKPKPSRVLGTSYHPQRRGAFPTGRQGPGFQIRDTSSLDFVEGSIPMRPASLIFLWVLAPKGDYKGGPSAISSRYFQVTGRHIICGNYGICGIARPSCHRVPLNLYA